MIRFHVFYVSVPTIWKWLSQQMRYFQSAFSIAPSNLLLQNLTLFLILAHYK